MFQPKETYVSDNETTRGQQIKVNLHVIEEEISTFSQKFIPSPRMKQNFAINIYKRVRHRFIIDQLHETLLH